MCVYYNHFLEHILNLNYKILSKKVEAKELGSFIAILCYFYIESLQCFSFLFLASCGLITPPLSPGTLFTCAEGDFGAEGEGIQEAQILRGVWV